MLDRSITVLFTTPFAGLVRNGPALYANLLSDAFIGDSRIDFHLLLPASDRLGFLKVVPGFPKERLHTFEGGRSSRQFYQSMCRQAIQLLDSSEFSNALVHTNVGHGVRRVLSHAKQSIIQINDYNAAQVYRSGYGHLKRGDWKRLSSFLWRHYSEQKALMAVDHVVCNSDYLVGEVQRCYRVPEKVDFHRIYKSCGGPPQECEAVSETEYPSNDITQIGFVGARWEEKGLDLAIAALSQLSSLGKTARLNVVGKIQSGHRKLSRLIAKHGVEDKVHFLGSVEHHEMSRFLRQMDLFLATSKSEAFGVAVVEALAAGLPVVAVRCGGIPEIVDGMRTSHLTDFSPGNIAAAIETVMGQDRSRAAAESRKHAKRFSSSVMVKSVRELYLRVSDASSLK